ncbi:MAG: VacB/RNase II family 3'-5' exoribonuclease, partial [Planctomycetota bacterium]|nr:VacB/RNase II family 3'-5' exoribonuclease [Planctomycetota bacterium]
MREKILAHLQSGHYQPAKVRGLARFFDVAEETYPEFRALIKAMIREGQIETGPRGKLRVPREPPAASSPPRERRGMPGCPAPSGAGSAARPGGRPGTVRGRFSLSDRGFGFVIPESPDGPTGAEDIFIGPNDTLGAVTNDTVLAEVKGKSPRGYYGRIVEIVERGQTRFVGTFYPAPEGGVVRPDGGILSQDFAVPDASSAGARPKDKVLFEVLRYALRGEPGEAVITKVLGQRGAPGVDTLCILHQFDLPLEFPEEVLAQASAAAARMDDAALEGRRDLTRETVITIDPADARDFDDAISLSEHADGTATLGVHIADVPYFVPEDSALDLEARERGTSVYLPTMVVPMLPEVLSNGVCSLQEGRTRLTKSAFIRIDPEGEPVGVELANSFIRSAKRLTYEQATAALEGKTGGLPPGIVDLLKAMDRLARRLLARRQRQGYLELDLPKVDLEFNEDGRVVAAHPEDTSFSHKIIEMFMVEANEAVARELQQAGLAFMRRIHPEPDDEAAEDLMHWRELQRLLAAVRGRPEAYGIHLVVLKSLQRAEYSIKPEGHYALASEAYCHFTSPIRRYPDLTVHRLFDALVSGQVEKPRVGRHKHPAGGAKAGRDPARQDDAAASPAAGSLAELAIHCSRTERRAEAAERELTKVKLLEYLQTRLGDTFTGVITGVQAFGVFVENSEFLIDGLVHISRLQDDTYQFDRQRWAL